MMEQRFTILLTDGGDRASALLAAVLQNAGCRVLRCPPVGETVLRLIAENRPDAAFLHAFMQGIDAAGVALRLQRLSPLERPLLAVRTAVKDPGFAAGLERLGVSRVFSEPPDVSGAARQIVSLLNEGKRTAEPDAVTALLWRLGIPAHMKGYDCLRTAVQMCSEDPSYMRAVTVRLYPDVAAELGTTPACVERAMRHAVSVAWERGPERFLPFFAVAAGVNPRKPNNSEFIATLAERVRACAVPTAAGRRR